MTKILYSSLIETMEGRNDSNVMEVINTLTLQKAEKF